ncbi:MAG: hypothetical protein P1V97_06210 [Planctomycetota bacterium]|nr:hypothetical protein [Planctomycetota bacterium]
MTETENKSSGTFNALSILAILWNLMGVLAFVAQQTMPIEELTKVPAEQELFKSYPLWATIGFGFGVFGGFLGSITLLLRKSIAVPLLVASLAGVLVQQSFMYFFSDTLKVMGPSSAIMPTVVLVIAIALIPFAKSATSATE